MLPYPPFRRIVMAAIEQVTYEVTSAFGDSPIGERRVAYAVGIDTDASSSTALLFHPGGRQACGSLEMAQVTPETAANIKRNRVYASHLRTRPTPTKDAVYVNLSKAQEKLYRQLVEQAGLIIPKTLVLSSCVKPPRCSAAWEFWR